MNKNMNKAIEENVLKIKIKRFVWKFNLYQKFMCSDKNKKKNERAKETYPLSPSTPLTVFLIAEKLLSLCV